MLAQTRVKSGKGKKGTTLLSVSLESFPKWSVEELPSPQQCLHRGHGPAGSALWRRNPPEETRLGSNIALGDNKSVHLGKKMLLEFVFLGSEFRRKRLGSTHMLQFDLLLGGCWRRCWKHLEDDVPEVELVVVDVNLLANCYISLLSGWWWSSWATY